MQTGLARFFTYDSLNKTLSFHSSQSSGFLSDRCKTIRVKTTGQNGVQQTLLQVVIFSKVQDSAAVPNLAGGEEDVDDQDSAELIVES